MTEAGSKGKIYLNAGWCSGTQECLITPDCDNSKVIVEELIKAPLKIPHLVAIAKLGYSIVINGKTLGVEADLKKKGISHKMNRSTGVITI